MENKSGKKTLGRQKIEIKKIEKKSSLQVTFTKRRRGLFRKASELALLCGAEVAIIVQSPAEKVFKFSHPSVETLMYRAGLSPEPSSAALEGQIVRHLDDARSKYEEAMKMLEMEKVRMMKREMIGGVWWDEPFEGLELHELEEFLVALEGLRENVAGRLEEFDKIFLMKSAAPSIDQEFSGGASAPIAATSSYLSHPVDQEFSGGAAVAPIATTSSYLSHPVDQDIYDILHSSFICTGSDLLN
ncbi:hypothetical protein C2S53_017571 [Perilla frutescens var. hirtella]|uniref:MADS-box domain-containing protein n=1 Tax=Perilla frutescens var. hirtella TaxID=608512 RepID=A0AAD4J1V6_PERFH|nr:hypothetical protein C2S53_017571 [Perilla frutescens var. hirtella]